MVRLDLELYPLMRVTDKRQFCALQCQRSAGQSLRSWLLAVVMMLQQQSFGWFLVRKSWFGFVSSVEENPVELVMWPAAVWVGRTVASNLIMRF